MKRLLISGICLPLCLVLGGCALFPSALRGMESLALVQALGVDREGDGVRLSMVTAADSSRGEGPVRMSGGGATISDAAEDAASHATSFSAKRAPGRTCRPFCVISAAHARSAWTCRC